MCFFFKKFDLVEILIDLFARFESFEIHQISGADSVCVYYFCLFCFVHGNFTVRAISHQFECIR